MKFRKKPVVIEAWQVSDGEATQEIPHWLVSAMMREEVAVLDIGGKTLAIKTLEGTMTANLGDWIIQGVKGELYPCKPDIFAATYEPVEAAKP